MVSNQGWIKDDVYQGQGLYVKEIAFPDADVNQPLYIDNVFIGSATDQCEYTVNKAIKKRSMSQTHLVKKLSAMLFFYFFIFFRKWAKSYAINVYVLRDIQ